MKAKAVVTKLLMLHNMGSNLTSMGAHITIIRTEKRRTPLQNLTDMPCFCPNRCLSLTSLISQATRNKLPYMSSSCPSITAIDKNID
jgi:hypothetical protein